MLDDISQDNMAKDSKSRKDEKDSMKHDTLTNDDNIKHDYMPRARPVRALHLPGWLPRF